ncbi:MAG: NAD-dependent epimerase/dehydratase family protein [Candidatus Edwardsbacteria bacterium]|jgi:nucleoside-diphosphate-sugar epimerase|nr:NAD-dependent epimerase/dehydratase family protein [Candidatus Edwardsbacteria bacterium]
MSPTTTLVTGATGFIGSHLAEALLRRGHRVRCLVRRTSDLRWLSGPEMELRYGSLDDVASLQDASRDADYVYHLAGAVKARDPGEFYRHNTEGALNVARAVLEAAPGLKRFLFASSQAAAGPAECLDRPVCEIDRCRPVSDYGKSKLTAEQQLRELSGKLPLTVIRPPSVYGPRDTEVFMYFQWIDRGVALLPGFRTRYAHLIHVKDLVAGMIAAAESPDAAGKTYFLAEDRAYSWQEISALIARALGRRPLRVHLPLFLAHFSAILAEAGAYVAKKPSTFTRQKVQEMSQSYWTVSAEAARRDFGFRCEYDLARGIAETAKWYKGTEWL